ncbi:MAG: MerR family transcriptional regulator [Chloroflexi bacterium]|nr:MerR family transcriptional regulator [Chloroflexota bacterium]
MGIQFVIGELAKRTGYSPAMIRYFEKAGAISPSARNPAGYRIFGVQHVRELRFVREMQNLGFHAQQINKLREIRLSDLPESEKGEKIRKVFEDHVRYVERKIAHFTGLKTRLEAASPDFVDLVLGCDREA